MKHNRVIVNANQINVNEHYNWLLQSPEDGAVVTFTGKVRSEGQEVISLFLEHYQGMTEKAINEIICEARQRWSIRRVAVVHRVGNILANEQIVFIGVSSSHRQAAFNTTEFIMDKLKNAVPLWKKERTKNQEEWVEAKKTDCDSLKKWY